MNNIETQTIPTQEEVDESTKKILERNPEERIGQLEQELSEVKNELREIKEHLQRVGLYNRNPEK